MIPAVAFNVISLNVHNDGEREPRDGTSAALAGFVEKSGIFGCVVTQL